MQEELDAVSFTMKASDSASSSTTGPQVEPPNGFALEENAISEDVWIEI